MTEPNEGAPAQPEPGNWQQPAASTSGFQPAPIAAGPAPGVAYADLVQRIIAYVIDAVIIGVVLSVVVVGLVVSLFFTGGAAAGIIGLVIAVVVSLIGSAIYFIYTWTTMRASPGQKILGLETVNAADGATLTRDQAIKRWAFLFGPAAIAQVMSLSGIGALGGLENLVSLLAFAYAIYLLYTVSQSQKRQGFHDVQAGTVVVKRVA
jgi:uncharacterized RDD family membrane protein YckC